LKNNTLIKTTYLLLTLISLYLPVYAQTSNGTIKGKVIDSQNNKPIAYASVGIWGTSIGTTTNEEGEFILEKIKPGFAELRVQLIGYKPFVSPDIMVTNANAVYIEIRMEEQSTELESVVIKASPFRRDAESPVSLRRIEIREIEKSPGSGRDISKVLQAFPGVGSGVSFRNDVIVRGGGSSENRFYLDGVEIPNLNHFATQGASGGPIGIINVDFIREVNFYSGAFPADRGNALSSVLEFKQIEPNQEKFKTRATIGASDLGLSLNGPISKNTGLLFSARRSYLQFLFSALGLPFLPIYNDFQFKTRTKIDANNEITVIGLGAIDNNKLNLSANKTENERYILGYLPENDQWNYTLGVVYKHFTEHGTDSWIVSRNMLKNISYKYKDNIETEGNKIFDYSSWEAENKFRYEHSTSFKSGVKLSYGAGTEYARYHNSTFRLKPTQAPDNYTSDLDLFKYNAFGQVSNTFINNKLTLSLGARSDGSSYSHKTNNPLTQLSPRFSASYQLKENLFLNGNIGRYYQLPPYTALGYRDGNGRLVNIDNDLTYTSVDNVVSGFDFLPNENSKITVEGFWKGYRHYPFSVNDSIALASKGADFGTFGDESLNSTGKGRAYGMEFFYSNKNLFGTLVTISYTLVRSEFEDIWGNYVPSAWDNRHIINILLSKNFKGNWDIGAKWRFVGGSPYTPAAVDLTTNTVSASAWDAQGRADYDYNRFNQERLGVFNQLDIRIDKSFFFNRWSLMVYFDVQNVLNTKSDQAPKYIRVEENGIPKPASGNPPRYAIRELESEGSGTVLPSVGIIVEF
jgi:hypothetical protein